MLFSDGAVGLLIEKKVHYGLSFNRNEFDCSLHVMIM